LLVHKTLNQFIGPSRLLGSHWCHLIVFSFKISCAWGRLIIIRLVLVIMFNDLGRDNLLLYIFQIHTWHQNLISLIASIRTGHTPDKLLFPPTNWNKRLLISIVLWSQRSETTAIVSATNWSYLIWGRFWLSWL
jgi:hypothetical protein